MKKKSKNQKIPSIHRRVEELKKKGIIPSDVKVITGIKEEDIGKLVAFRATIRQKGIKMSPPIVVIDEFEG